ncbi:MAG: RodZ domain-containing protein [Acidimicrobiales bacterium]
MTIVVAAVAVLVVVALVSWAVRRRTVDEVHSVDGYRHTLDTLQDIRTRSGGSTVRVLGGGATPGTAAPGPETAGTGSGGTGRAGTTGDLERQGRPGGPPGGTPHVAGEAGGGRRSGRGGLVFDDQPPAPHGGASQRGDHRGEDRAISAMNHRPRRLGAPILVGLVVLALLAVVVYIGARSPHHGTPPAGHGTGKGTTTTTAAGAGGGGHGHGTTTTSAPRTTTTTAPQTYTAVTSSATAASYTPPSGSYTVTLAATTGNCWVTVSSSSGSSLLSQTLTAGQSVPVTASGQTTIVVGAPSVVRVSIDHRPVVLPTGYQTPFTITLTPAS